MVFSGVYPIDASDYPDLREALDKLKLSDAALQYEPETSVALGFGFRCGFLGLLHLEIITERLEREFDLDLITTAPSVPYEVTTEDRKTVTVTNPSEYPTGRIDSVLEPIVKASILAPKDYVGAIMELCQTRRGTMKSMDYLGEDRVELKYTMPLGEIVFDFFDQLKSRTQGYASLDYEPSGQQEADLVKVDILLQGEAVDAFSAIVHRDKAYAYGTHDDRPPPRADPAPAVRGAHPGRDRRSRSSPVRTSERCARTCSPSATAATSPASASCSRSRRRARSG